MLTFLKPGKTYHVYTHANGFENLFRCDRNYLYFLDKYRKYIHPVADTYAYCLMPNHLHLMLKIKSEKEVLDFLKTKRPDLQAFLSPGDFSLAISRQFSHMFNGYTQAYNRMYDRMGSLFIPNFKRKHVDSLDYFKKLLFYIHNNPVNHGFVKSINDWSHSSYHSYIEKEKNPFVNTEQVLKVIGGIEVFEELHRKNIISKSFIKMVEEFQS